MKRHLWILALLMAFGPIASYGNHPPKPEGGGEIANGGAPAVAQRAPASNNRPSALDADFFNGVRESWKEYGGESEEQRTAPQPRKRAIRTDE